MLISAEDLESLEATIELLADEDAVRRVREAEAAVSAGELTTVDEMDELMRQRRERTPRGV